MSKIITLKRAIALLQSADVVHIVNDGYVEVNRSFSDLTGDPDNEFLYVSWEEEGLEYSVTFNEGENKKISCVGNALVFIDTEGQEAEFHLYKLSPINA